MASYLSRVNKLLTKQLPTTTASDAMLAGPGTYEAILSNEMNKCLLLDNLEKVFISDLTKATKMRTMTEKQKQSLMMDVHSILCDSREFVFKAAELHSKDGFMQKVVDKVIDATSECTVTESGQEVYKSDISDEVRSSLSKLIRAQINDITRR